LVLLLAATATALVACAPEFPGTPPIAPYSGSASKTVLLIGDSLMGQTALFIADTLAQHQLPFVIENRARGGSVVTPGTAAGIDWANDLPAILDAVHPDLVVAHFIGHGDSPEHPVGSPGWQPWAETNVLKIADEVLSRGIPLYWVVPPVTAWNCTWDLGQTLTVYKAMADWYRTGLVAQRPAIHLVDWRTPISPDETRFQSLDFGPYGIQAVRPGDCVHLTPLGAQIAADATVAAIRPEWDRPPPTTTTTTTTTTTVPPSSTTTTTTTPEPPTTTTVPSTTTSSGP
jgi:hypothetical protein